MTDILKKIVKDKKIEVQRLKVERPVATLEKLIAEQKPPLDFARALTGDKTSIIAEIKKASPSKGNLAPNLDHVAQAKLYQQGSAAAISVLTESKYFMGNINYLADIRDKVNIPILRKDFIFDAYQIYEARAYGADALLLIVAILEQTQLTDLIALARDLKLGCLIEVHDEYEMKRAADANAKIIGINNRDLKTFNVDINTTKRLLPLVPDGAKIVSESGIKNRSDIKTLNSWKVNAALIGESLVTASDALQKLKELVL
ncbi:MAG: indole-3-glycerol phosphate synthase TrpC [Chloroflexi bacterium]|jgi:indole-3-glycerol phosphate synthase|nr:indole-3-glycerol phosphate synthase TrpC [Chloroflexota bacterium]MBT7081140.1 indole-3-glycerol phosphate synthase TrpC [Chloroflexota bacterium]MBT7289290.1 indole-3-glycerol phosphate synthase TrpC [Chloroflexota bacterium]